MLETMSLNSGGGGATENSIHMLIDFQKVHKMYEVLSECSEALNGCYVSSQSEYKRESSTMKAKLPDFQLL